MQGKGNDVFCKALMIGIGALLLVLISVVSTGFMIKSYAPEQICGRSNSLNFGNKVHWSGAQKFKIPGRDTMVSRGEKRCYIYPTPEKDFGKFARPLEVIQQVLKEEAIEHLAGEIGVEACRGLDAYMLRELVPGLNGVDRVKRAAYSPVPYDQRAPRCKDFLLDCQNSVGTTVDCHTSVAGVLKMGLTCESETTFTSKMVKPPVRLTELMQKAALLCQKRFRSNMAC